MDAQASRKLIIAGVMAVAVGAGVTTFALRAHTVARIPQAVTAPAELGAVPVAPAAQAPVEPTTAPVSGG